MTIVEDLQNVISELEQEHQIAHINVELVDNDLAFIYSNSKKAEVFITNFIVTTLEYHGFCGGFCLLWISIGKTL